VAAYPRLRIPSAMILNSEMSGIFRAATTGQMVKGMAPQGSVHQLSLVKGCLGDISKAENLRTSYC